MPEVNWVAVLVATVLNMALGSIWYSRSVFGKEWMRLMGKKDFQMSDDATRAYILTVIGALVMAAVLAVFLKYTDASTFAEGVITGLWAGIGFVVPSALATSMFAGQDMKLYLINTGYPVAALAVMGGVIATLS